MDPAIETERAMKVQEVEFECGKLLEFGCNGLFDRRKTRPKPQKCASASWSKCFSAQD
jgi:hypothetical protein